MTPTDALIIEMQAITRLASEPWEPGDSVKVAISRAAHVLDLPYRRARSFWYGEPVSLRAFEADQMRAAERALLIKRHRRLEHELAMIEERLDRLAALNEAKAGHAAFVQRKNVGGCEMARPAARIEPGDQP